MTRPDPHDTLEALRSTLDRGTDDRGLAAGSRGEATLQEETSLAELLGRLGTADVRSIAPSGREVYDPASRSAFRPVYGTGTRRTGTEDEPSVPVDVPLLGHTTHRPQPRARRRTGTTSLEESEVEPIVARPLLETGRQRAEAIMGNLPGLIDVADNPGVEANPHPWYARPKEEQVMQHDMLIEEAAARHELDPDLVKAVVWIETTHGWYDALTGVIKPPKTLRPMNVHVEFWKDLGVTREQLTDPRTNIEAGTYILASIAERLVDPTPEKIFTLYNNLHADAVSTYGKTAAYYFVTKPWRE